MEMLFVLFLFQGVVVGLFCSYVAKTKGRSGINWFLLGLFFSGLALLALVAIPKIEPVGVAAPMPSPSVPMTKPVRPDEGYQGEMDVSLIAYQLFLTKQFSIEKNATLGVFSIRNEAFATLEDALRVADSRYRQQMAQTEAEAAKASADAEKALAEAAKRDRAVAVAKEHRAAMNRRRTARLKRVMTIAIPVVAALAGGLWLLRPEIEIYMAEAAKVRECERLPGGGATWCLKKWKAEVACSYRVGNERTKCLADVSAEDKIQRCNALPEGEAARCLKHLKAEEACAHVGGVDSIKCLSDYMSR